jgi:gamma-glutamyl-gamma-aminobutyrate hydrolase PuuD
MNVDTNSSQTATISSGESPESVPSYHLRHIYDGLEFQQLNLKVCLSGPAGDRYGFNNWLGRAGCRFVDEPLEADFVVFTGGSDVSPKLYGAAAIAETCASADRDNEDIELYHLCEENGVPMLGICRGAQFLWTRQGGSLYQDIDGHNDGEHEILCFSDRKKYRASSVHHQMCKPESLRGFKLLANSVISTKRKTDIITHTGPTSDFEIYVFPEKAILGIQGHPEYAGYPNYSELCIRLIDEYIYDNPATFYSKGSIRVKTKETV